jgi:hypothetical protein
MRGTVSYPIGTREPAGRVKFSTREAAILAVALGLAGGGPKEKTTTRADPQIPQITQTGPKRETAKKRPQTAETEN